MFSQIFRGFFFNGVFVIPSEPSAALNYLYAATCKSET